MVLHACIQPILRLTLLLAFLFFSFHPQVYDPQKKWDSYTIHGAETYGEGNSSTLSHHGVMRTA